jgi:signal peptidase complex subunit 3
MSSMIRKKGRQRYWGAREEELGSLRFDVQVDLQPLLESYNTKQLFLYLTADLEETDGSATHEVVLWDRIITRGDMRDFRAVGKQPKRSKGSRKGRGKIRLEDGKNKYPFKMPSGSFKYVYLSVNGGWIASQD